MQSGLQSFSQSLLIVLFLLVITDFVNSTRCPHCNAEFKVLGRHIWRCPSKGTAIESSTEQLHPAINIHEDRTTGVLNTRGPTSLPPLPSSPTAHSAGSNEQVDWHVCHCGRRCKGRRGLRAHQRHCKTMDTLLDENPSIDRVAFNIDTTFDMDDGRSHSSNQVYPDLTAVPGLRLPKTKAAWEEAHAYFLAHPPLPTHPYPLLSTTWTNVCYRFNHRCMTISKVNVGRSPGQVLR